MGSLFPDQGSNPCSLHWQHRVLATGPPGKSLGFLYKSISLSKPYSFSGKKRKEKKGINILMGMQWRPDGEKCQKSRSRWKESSDNTISFPHLPGRWNVPPSTSCSYVSLPWLKLGWGLHALSSLLAGSRSPILLMKPSYLPSSGRVMAPFFVAQDLAFSVLLIFLEFRHF